MDKIFKTVYYVVLGCLGIIALFLIASLFPIPGNYRIMVVLSGSMKPTIKTGSIIVTKPRAAYTIGDIITFGPDTKKQVPTTHRITALKDDGFITRGDSNDAADTSLVRSGDIIGEVLFSVPYLGYAVSAAKTRYGFLLLIGVPALVIITDEIRKIWRELLRLRRKKKHEQENFYN